MSPSRAVQKSVTPGSVKALMILQAIVIAFFSFWLANEYVYNVYFRIDANSVFVEHLTTYTVALGLGIGLAGTAVAAALYKTMREAKMKLETVAPKIKGAVEKMLSNAPVGNAGLATTDPTTNNQLAPTSTALALSGLPTVSSQQAADEKK